MSPRDPRLYNASSALETPTAGAGAALKAVNDYNVGPRQWNHSVGEKKLQFFLVYDTYITYNIL